jgi:hypothetical protein
LTAHRASARTDSLVEDAEIAEKGICGKQRRSLALDFSLCGPTLSVRNILSLSALRNAGKNCQPSSSVL